MRWIFFWEYQLWVLVQISFCAPFKVNVPDGMLRITWWTITINVSKISFAMEKARKCQSRSIDGECLNDRHRNPILKHDCSKVFKSSEYDFIGGFDGPCLVVKIDYSADYHLARRCGFWLIDDDAVCTIDILTLYFTTNHRFQLACPNRNCFDKKS